MGDFVHEKRSLNIQEQQEHARRKVGNYNQEQFDAHTAAVATSAREQAQADAAKNLARPVSQLDQAQSRGDVVGYYSFPQRGSEQARANAAAVRAEQHEGSARTINECKLRNAVLYEITIAETYLHLFAGADTTAPIAEALRRFIDRMQAALS